MKRIRTFQENQLKRERRYGRILIRSLRVMMIKFIIVVASFATAFSYIVG